MEKLYCYTSPTRLARSLDFCETEHRAQPDCCLGRSYIYGEPCGTLVTLYVCVVSHAHLPFMICVPFILWCLIRTHTHTHSCRAGPEGYVGRAVAGWRPKLTSTRVSPIFRWLSISPLVVPCVCVCVSLYLSLSLPAPCSR